MQSSFSRRNLMKGIASSVLAPSLLPVMAAAQAGTKPDWMGNGMPQEGPDTPKIADSINFGWVRPPRPGAVWVQPKYKKHGKAYHFSRGRWK